MAPLHRSRVLASLSLLASCARAPTVEHRVDDGPPPTIELALDVRGHQLGLVGAAGGPMCEGTISGEVVVVDPHGREERSSVQDVPTWAERCVGCDPVAGDPDSCDHACERAPIEWIELLGYSFLPDGRYRISGEGLRLSCAPAHARFVGLEVDVDDEGFVHVAEPGSEPIPVKARVRGPNVPPRDDTTATELWTQGSRTPPVTATSVEGLVVPVQAHRPLQGVSPTAWGPLRTMNAGTPHRFLTADDGPYWVTVAGPGAEIPLVLERVFAPQPVPYGTR
jgi:hypothetical protein